MSESNGRNQDSQATHVNRETPAKVDKTIDQRIYKHKQQIYMIQVDKFIN